MTSNTAVLHSHREEWERECGGYTIKEIVVVKQIYHKLKKFSKAFCKFMDPA